METVNHVRLSADGTKLVILDQTLLPGREAYLELSTVEEMYEAIRALRVRGAPCLGVFAGFAMYVLAQSFPGDGFRRRFHAAAAYLDSSRPTAVNLGRALRRMAAVVDGNGGLSPAELLPLLRREAQAILEEDISMCRAISEHGLALLREGDRVLTHCNAGPLATTRYGTALGPLILGAERGMRLGAWVDETRPLLQGARLTAWELDRAGVDVTLICDNMAASVMARGDVRAVFVGCDRVAANGDTANKIGTFGLAVLAKHFGVPFYVLGPTSTIDLNCPTGADIEIEQRDGEEIRSLWYREPMAPAVRCFNPAFDVTDHGLITGIITEKGICRPPFSHSLAGVCAASDAER